MRCVYKKIWIVSFLLLEVDTQETEAIFLRYFFSIFFLFFLGAFDIMRQVVSLAVQKQSPLSRETLTRSFRM